MSDEVLSLRDVRFGFERRPDFLGPVTLAVRRGNLWAILGPNGAGKSTLLRLMAGFLKPSAGEIRLLDQPIRDFSSRRRARHLAFLPQQVRIDVDLCVRDVVLLGRFPHRALGLFDSPQDVRIAEEAMAETETLEFADRPLSTLSGGEAQRVHLAAEFAQQPEVLLLDEPTAALDIQHQVSLFRMLRARTLDDSLTIVVVTHDVNLAAQFCTHVLLLSDGRVAGAGPPDSVLTPETLSPVFHVPLATLRSPDHPGRRWVVPVDGVERDRP